MKISSIEYPVSLEGCNRLNDKFPNAFFGVSGSS